MYIYIMKRTQIYIDEDMYSALKRKVEMKNTTISEVVRECVQETLMKDTEKILKALDEICGMWKKRKIDVKGFIRTLRRDRRL